MSDYNLLNPSPILRKACDAKRLSAPGTSRQAGEWRIATSGHRRSASPIAGSAYSAGALRRIFGGKIGEGSLFSKISLTLALENI